MRLFYFLPVLFMMSFSLPAQSYKVMTYNLRFDNPDDDVNAWPNRKQKVFDLLKKYDPDILDVQEALVNQLQDITKALPQYEYVGVGRDDGKEKGEFSAILYKKKKFKLLDQNTFWLSEHPDSVGSKSWDAAITRIVTWAKFSDAKSKKEFVVMNTHFDHIGKEARKQSAALLKSKIPSITKSHALILTGDLNCTRDEPPYAELINPSNVTLIDPAPESPLGTYCGFAVGKMECRPIDYIFATLHWQVSDYKVINDNDGSYYPSDHLPVMVTVQRNEP